MHAGSQREPPHVSLTCQRSLTHSLTHSKRFCIFTQLCRTRCIICLDVLVSSCATDDLPDPLRLRASHDLRCESDSKLFHPRRPVRQGFSSRSYLNSWALLLQGGGSVKATRNWRPNRAATTVRRHTSPNNFLQVDHTGSFSHSLIHLDLSSRILACGVRLLQTVTQTTLHGAACSFTQHLSKTPSARRSTSLLGPLLVKGAQDIVRWCFSQVAPCVDTES